MDLIGFLISYARKIWIEADAIKHFLSYELSGCSVGHYTDIAHFQLHRLNDQLIMLRYFFSDVGKKPWGSYLPKACSACACIEPWSERKLQNNGTIVAQCVYPTCNKKMEWPKPDGAQVFSRDVGLAKWYVIEKIL